MLQNFYSLGHLKEAYSIRKRVALITVFLAIAPLTLIISIFSLFTFTSVSASETPVFANPTNTRNNVYVYASLEDSIPSVSGQVLGVDARADLLAYYIADQYENSPLLDHTDYLVEISDKYDLDYRLLVAIAQKESGMCRLIPDNSHNCWGWGIHSEGTLRFDNYTESIEAVSYGIRNNYHDLGLVTPEEIMSKWVPHSPEGIWATNVDQFMSEIK